MHQLKFVLLKATLLVCQDEPAAKLETVSEGSTIEVLSEETTSGTVRVRVNGHYGYMFYCDLMERAEPFDTAVEEE